MHKIICNKHHFRNWCLRIGRLNVDIVEEKFKSNEIDYHAEKLLGHD